jgi:hypothetical protein
MQNIRHGVFETNSSSCHSISISEDSDGLMDVIYPNGDGKIELEGGEFGWQEEEFNDALTKANYCYIDNFHYQDRLDRLVKVISDQTGVKKENIVLNASLDYSTTRNWSYIDHQSAGTSFEAFESDEKLRQFIFNPKSILRTDNDNH